MTKAGLMPTPTRGPRKALAFLVLVVLVVLIIRDPVGAADAAHRVFGWLDSLLTGLTRFGSALSR